MNLADKKLELQKELDKELSLLSQSIKIELEKFYEKNGYMELSIEVRNIETQSDKSYATQVKVK